MKKKRVYFKLSLTLEFCRWLFLIDGCKRNGGCVKATTQVYSLGGSNSTHKTAVRSVVKE